jgi:hypothetical protein
MTIWQKINVTAWFLVSLLVVVLVFSGLGERLAEQACR